MSLDRDTSDRSGDRQMAYLGLLEDAAPMFRDGERSPTTRSPTACTPHAARGMRGITPRARSCRV